MKMKSEKGEEFLEECLAQFVRELNEADFAISIGKQHAGLNLFTRAKDGKPRTATLNGMPNNLLLKKIYLGKRGNFVLMFDAEIPNVGKYTDIAEVEILKDLSSFMTQDEVVAATNAASDMLGTVFDALSPAFKGGTDDYRRKWSKHRAICLEGDLPEGARGAAVLQPLEILVQMINEVFGEENPAEHFVVTDDKGVKIPVVRKPGLKSLAGHPLYGAF